MTKEALRKQFYSQDKIELTEKYASVVRKNEHFHAYQLAQSGQAIWEIHFDLGLGEDVEIAQLTDVHLNRYDALDWDDAEIMDTVQHRMWLRNGEGVLSAQRAMDAAQYSDLTVVSGDILDFLSHGAREIAEAYLFRRDPSALFMPGGHDYLKEMQTGKPEQLPFEQREAILKSFWPNALHYAARLVKNKVLVIGLDDNQSHYLPELVPQLQADIERAKKMGWKILLFQHEPISTLDPADTAVPAIAHLYHDEMDFYDAPYLLGAPHDSNETDRAMYRLILENTDVVKGIFAGHYHSVYYTEIKGENGAKVPQVVAPGCTYFDMAGVITRICLH